MGLVQCGNADARDMGLGLRSYWFQPAGKNVRQPFTKFPSAPIVMKCSSATATRLADTREGSPPGKALASILPTFAGVPTTLAEGAPPLSGASMAVKLPVGPLRGIDKMCEGSEGPIFLPKLSAAGSWSMF